MLNVEIAHTVASLLLFCCACIHNVLSIYIKTLNSRDLQECMWRMSAVGGDAVLADTGVRLTAGQGWIWQ